MDGALRKLFLAHLGRDFDRHEALGGRPGAPQPNPDHWRRVVASWFGVDPSGAFTNPPHGIRQPQTLPPSWRPGIAMGKR